MTRSLNRGLERCRAPLVARADADDRYDARRLERQVAFMEAHPEVGLLSCAVEKMTAKGVVFATSRFPTRDETIRIRELFVNSFSHPGSMFRREIVHAVGGYDPTYWTAEDADLWSRLRPHTRFANLEEPLVRYRVVGSSMMRTRGAEGSRLSLSVRQRNLSEYLGRDVSSGESQAITDLFKRRGPLSPGDVAVGVRGFWEVLHRAAEREGTATVRYLRKEGSAALRWQAWLQRTNSTRFALWLLGVALRYDPRPGTALRIVKGAVTVLRGGREQCPPQADPAGAASS